MHYYLDSREGDDNADGRSPQTAWRTLAKANDHTFAPGDSLLLRRGCSWTGETLAPRGSGTPEKPILIDAYGEGEQPLIDRQGGFSDTENATEAVCLTNQSYWTIRHLTVSNTNPADPGQVEPPLIDWKRFAMFPLRHGLIIRATFREGVRRTTVRGIVIQECRAENIDGTNGDEGNSYRWELCKGEEGVLGRSGSVCIGAIVTDNPTGVYRAHMEGLLIEGCTVHNAAGSGIRLDSEAWSYRDSYRGAVIRGNNLCADPAYANSHAGMYIVGAENALVEYNRFCHYANGQAYQNCQDGTTRYNFMYDLTGKLSETAKMAGYQTYWDAMGVDVDSHCTGEFHITANIVANMKDCGFSSFNFETVSECRIVVEHNIFFNSDFFFNHQNGEHGYTFVFRRNTFIRDGQNRYGQDDKIMSFMHKTPHPGTYLHTGNVYFCPGQAMVFDTRSSVYAGNLYCGERGGVPEEGFLTGDPALRIPVMEELEDCSYDGEIQGTRSFCATDWFEPLEGSPCIREGSIVLGADPAVVRAGRH